jgi:hypothetical protein
VQAATDWVRSYFRKNKAAFDLIAKEVLSLKNPHWSLRNTGNGFSPDYLEVTIEDWEALSQSTQRSIEAIDADFRKEFGKIEMFMGCEGRMREDGRRAFHIVISPGIFIRLSYFPDGYADERSDTPFVEFGDKWYFYCDDRGGI